MEMTTCIDLFVSDLRARDYAEHTIEVYVSALQKFQAYLTERSITKVTRISRQDMRTYHARVMAAPLAMETRAQHIRAVKRLFEYLTATYSLLINPTEGLVETCRRGLPPRPILTASDLQALRTQPNLSWPNGLRDRAIIEVLLAAGLRTGELLRLRRSHCDLPTQTLVIHSRHGSCAHERRLPLSDAACEALSAYLNHRQPEQADLPPDTSPLWLTITGTPLSKQSLQAILARHGTQAGIRIRVSPQLLRRTWTVLQLQQGVSLSELQQRLGHSSQTSTWNYLHLTSRHHAVTTPSIALDDRAPIVLPSQEVCHDS